MLQLWGEAEVAGADAEDVDAEDTDAEDADVVALDDVEAWDSDHPRLQTTITKEGRRHPQAQDHRI